MEYRLLEGPLQPGARQQLAIYADCLARHGAKHAWMGGWVLLLRSSPLRRCTVYPPFLRFLSGWRAGGWPGLRDWGLLWQ